MGNIIQRKWKFWTLQILLLILLADSANGETPPQCRRPVQRARKLQTEPNPCDQPRGRFTPIQNGSKFFTYPKIPNPPPGYCLIIENRNLPSPTQQDPLTHQFFVDQCARSGLELAAISSMSDITSIFRHPEIFKNDYFALGLKRDVVHPGNIVDLQGNRALFMYTDILLLRFNDLTQGCFQMMNGTEDTKHMFNDAPCGIFTDPSDPTKWSRNCALCQHPLHSQCYNESLEEKTRETQGMQYVGTLPGDIPLYFSKTQQTFFEAEFFCALHNGRLVSEYDGDSERGPGDTIYNFFKKSQYSTTTSMWLKESLEDREKNECRAYNFVSTLRAEGFDAVEYGRWRTGAVPHRTPFNCSTMPNFFFCVVPKGLNATVHVVHPPQTPTGPRPITPEETCVFYSTCDVQTLPCHCDRFFRCVERRFVEGFCPSGLHFNNLTKECDTPENVQCNMNPPDPRVCPCPSGYKPMEDNVKCSSCYVYQYRDLVTGECEQEVRGCDNQLIFHHTGRDEEEGGETGFCDFPINVPGCS